MKKPFLTLFVAFATLCGFAQEIVQSKADHYNIIGELKNIQISKRGSVMLPLFLLSVHLCSQLGQ